MRKVYKNEFGEEIIKGKCAGCNKEIEDIRSGQSLDDESKRAHFVDDSRRGAVALCEACHKEWSDVPKGFRLEVNPSTGGLWYRPLNQKEKREVMSDNLYDPKFMIGWWIKGSIIVLIILAIAQFL